MSSLNHGRYKDHRRDYIGTREQPATLSVDKLAYAMRPRANLNPHSGLTHFMQAMRYHDRAQGLVRRYRMVRAQHLQHTCALGCWPFLMAGPIGLLP